MHFFPGRRHSVSTATPASEATRRTTETPPRRASFSPENSRDPGRNVLRNLFQRHDAVPATGDASTKENQIPANKRANGDTNAPPNSNTTKPKEESKSLSRRRSKSLSSKTKDPNHGGKRIEEKNTSESTSSTTNNAHPDTPPSSETHLSRKDVHAIFSGAPYFLLEKGKHDMWYPQVIFPWDDHDPTIQHLWDRRVLPHPSYALCTLHAHLPVPDGWVVEGDTPVHLDSWKRTGAPRRATFDIGIFEVPNMLSMSGKEPGTVGFRHFLELPVADSVRFVPCGKPRLQPDLLHIATLPAMEADQLLEHYHEAYSQCHDGTIHDRKKLLFDGPFFWKKIGLRDISLKALVDRLQTLRSLRHESLYENPQKTILDAESMHELYSDLFTKFLYPPSRFMLMDLDNRHGLKAEIKALTMVLATPGAWLDFSLVEWRLRIGQLLWEATPHVDGDFLDPSTIQKPWVNATLEQKWFLIQMLLAAELLLRLDAIVRVGLVQNSKDVHVSTRDIYHFDKLRNPKVDWDLVVVRRFLDSFEVSWSVPQSDSISNSLSQPSSHERHNEKPHHFSFFESLKRRHSVPAVRHIDPAGSYKLVPIHVEQQVHGLLVFAENIGWPGLASLKANFDSRMQDDRPGQNIMNIFNGPVRSTLPEGHATAIGKDDMFHRSTTRRPVALHYSTDGQPSPVIGGWITRSWLSGFVPPGDVINHLLMATILENDLEAMAKLGPIVNLYGGFSYDGKSWWSQQCIVGRVLSPLNDTKACMGWLRSPIIPRKRQSLEALEDTWFEVVVSQPPTGLGKPRIKQGNKISIESTPLGLGSLTGDEFILPVDDSPGAKSQVEVKFDTLTFSANETEQQDDKHTGVAYKATMSFKLASGTDTPTIDISFPLTYNVNFVTSHACRLPPGLAACHHAPTLDDGDNERSLSPAEAFSQKHGRLPGHPLLGTYKHKFLALDALPAPEESITSKIFEHAGFDLTVDEVFVVDSRGSAEKEALARSWCASVGYDAIIGRTGRTCLACCIREARALAVKVVIRVGDD